MNEKRTGVSSVDICRARASGLASLAVVACPTLPLAEIAPAANNIASVSVVLPLPCGPTMATQRVPRAPLGASCTLSNISTLLAEPLTRNGRGRCERARRALPVGARAACRHQAGG